MPAKVALVVETGFGCYLCGRQPMGKELFRPGNAYLHLIKMRRQTKGFAKYARQMKWAHTGDLCEFV